MSECGVLVCYWDSVYDDDWKEENYRMSDKQNNKKQQKSGGPNSVHWIFLLLFSVLSACCLI